MDDKEQVNTNDEVVDTKNEVVDTKVKKEYIMTPSRSENLRKARLKATLLREQLKEKKKTIPVEPKPKTKMEKKLQELEDKTKDVVKLNDDKDIKSEDKPSASEMETTTQVESNDKAAEDAKPHKPIEPTPKAEAPKAEEVVKLEPPKPKPALYRREGNYLYM
jgi:hypothetical protein